jgi:acyl carrier protein
MLGFMYLFSHLLALPYLDGMSNFTVRNILLDDSIYEQFPILQEKLSTFTLDADSCKMSGIQSILSSFNSIKIDDDKMEEFFTIAQVCQTALKHFCLSLDNTILKTRQVTFADDIPSNNAVDPRLDDQKSKVFKKKRRDVVSIIQFKNYQTLEWSQYRNIMEISMENLILASTPDTYEILISMQNVLNSFVSLLILPENIVLHSSTLTGIHLALASEFKRYDFTAPEIRKFSYQLKKELNDIFIVSVSLKQIDWLKVRDLTIAFYDTILPSMVPNLYFGDEVLLSWSEYREIIELALVDFKAEANFEEWESFEDVQRITNSWIESIVFNTQKTVELRKLSIRMVHMGLVSELKRKNCSTRLIHRFSYCLEAEMNHRLPSSKLRMIEWTDAEQLAQIFTEAFIIK